MSNKLKMPGGRQMFANFEQLPSTLSVNVVTESSDNMKLPKVRVEAILLHFYYKVTDVGIEADELLRGAIKKLQIGQGTAMYVDLAKDEIDVLIDYINAGTSDGAYYDALPTTAEYKDAYFLIPGPFRFQDLQDPRIYLTMEAEDEWGAASAFVMTMHAHLLVSDYQDGDGIVYTRTSLTSSTKHRVIPPARTFCDLVTGAFIKLGASNMDEIIYPRQSKSGESIVGQTAINFDDCFLGLANYAAFKEASAPTTGRYSFSSFENYPGAEDITVDCSNTGATSCLAFVQGMKFGPDTRKALV